MDNKTNTMIIRDDGKYYWEYNLNLYKDLTYLFILFKIMGIGLAVVWLVCIISTFSKIEDIYIDCISFTKIFGLIGLISIVIITICYYAYVYIGGGSYCMTFKMHARGISVGVVHGFTLYSEFANIRKIKLNKKHNMIEIRQLPFRNLIFVSEEDFDFVASYIKKHGVQIEFIEQ